MSQDDSAKAPSMARITRRSFAAGAAAALAGFGGLAWIGTRELEDGLPWPLRRVLDLNDRLGQKLFSESHLATTYPIERAEDLRINQYLGLKSPINLAKYEVRIAIDGIPGRSLPL